MEEELKDSDHHHLQQQRKDQEQQHHLQQRKDQEQQHHLQQRKDQEQQHHLQQGKDQEQQQQQQHPEEQERQQQQEVDQKLEGDQQQEHHQREEQERQQQQEEDQQQEHQWGKEKEQQAVGERKSGEGGICGFISSCCCTSGDRRTAKKNQNSSRELNMINEDNITEADLRGVINADAHPEHLVILVNGIIGSAADWKFAARKFEKLLGQKVAIHCSEASSYKKTYDGVDVMGKRLADEVRVVIGKTHGVKKISFLAHSLGGLISRYAISQLYHSPSHNLSEGITDPHINSQITTEAAQAEPTIAGLEAENFITLATPHLGCRGTKQLPCLFGIEALEKTAPFFAHWFIGKTGKHLFLTDGSGTELPLLKKMATDCKEGKFISSLRAFKRRTVYANVSHDRLVGWGTASIRRHSELEKIQLEQQDRSNSQRDDDPYPHIIREEGPPVGDLSISNTRPSKANLGMQPEDLLEEDMVSGLTQVSWHRVDVSFRGAKLSYLAHNLIQVKNEKQHDAGSDVIEHVIKKQFPNYL